jgi:acyl-coenzyme A thioesterase PaaI-like protein
MPTLPGLENPLFEFLGVTMRAWREGYVELQLPLVPTLLNRSG